MASKCVHKGCGKVFTDPDEPCHYHPGPPEFHEGQKGWKCCKTRVLTFDEFMEIPPCTTGKHSTVDDTPAPPPKPNDEEIEAKIRQQKETATLQPAVARVAVTSQPPRATPSPAPPPEDEDDDPTLPIPDGSTCKRRGCGATYKAGQSREGEKCTHHPGQPLFHEGTKGWTCCKKRVLEFDEFMNLPGCTTKPLHCFVGRKTAPSTQNPEKEEEELKDVRNDFYQTSQTVIASLYLKKIVRERSKVVFADANTIELDLHTSDGKHYATSMELFANIKPEESSYKILGTKVELTLAKAEGTGWPVLRASDPHSGTIIQAGRAGRA